MAMLIAWQTINAVRRPGSKQFTRGFLVVAPRPDHQGPPARAAAERPGQLLRHPRARAADMLPDIKKAKIVITNYHAFKLRERIELSKGGRALLQGPAARN
jgi:type III restriction enzyme